MRPATYTLAEFAARYGVTMDWLYRHRERLHADGLPRPVSTFGRPRLPRAAVDQWLAGHRCPAPANDAAPAAAAQTIEEQRAHLAAIYGGY